MKAPVICIDGPNASGKGAISRALAEHLGWHRLDSGVLYRALGLAASRRSLSPADSGVLAALAAELDVDLHGERILLDGEDVTRELGTEEAGTEASRVAVLAPVRAALLERQRGFRRPPGLVADGRDMGTVVFPDAKWKVFLTASPEVRAARRYNQLRHQGMDVSLAGLFEAIRERDERDRLRDTAPLRPANGALQLDTTHLGVSEVLACVIEHVRTTGRSMRPEVSGEQGGDGHRQRTCGDT
ncbi:MAG: (d)CMP kinase [Immundisolibacterales bacterium]|nr:(d)CMP kinase [Immundisolibacterales bacterium]